MAESTNVRNEKLVADEGAGENHATSNSSESTPKAASNASNQMVAVAAGGSSLEIKTVLPETSVAVLERVARQVEYYFSTSNLSKDTYLATLRSLNDGYVPISIIAKFGKIISLVPYDALNAVKVAAEEHSELLNVVKIDTQTGKIHKEGTSTNTSQTVDAVGPVSGEPIPMNLIPKVPVSPPAVKTMTSSAAPVQNTLIIREAPEGTEESQIRDLFQFEKCPPIQSLHLDVANCWYVTLDTNSKDDMIHVMFELRTKKFPSGEPVKARVKSAAAPSLSANASPYSPPMMMNMMSGETSMLTPMMMYAPQLTTVPPQVSSRNAKKGNQNGKKKKSGPSNRSRSSGNNNSSGSSSSGNSGVNKNGKKNVTSTTNNNSSGNNNNQRQKNNNNNNGTKQQQPKKTGNIPGNSSQKSSGQARTEGENNSNKPVVPLTPPPMGEENFPALPVDDSINNKKIVETVPKHGPEDDLVKPGGGSDGASTATTTSSSSSSKNVPAPQSVPQPVGGYAAALLKAAPPKPVIVKKEKETPSTKKSKEATKKADGKKTKASAKNDNNTAAKSSSSTVANQDASSNPPLVSEPPSWGGGRSFADVLRKEQAAV